ncbi:hypothetical protein AUJ95_09550 [Candidatus Desantisbacteria bacterium CG2_30_40_21]|uniref:Uncharacterized protein n=5 Tax=unclassified Candidatus Desantisiibacteriota TaxID=3106372 RepID=A0A2M7JD14_9BACT|nr:MAG: hypothetical protein AUJ95_09550 [Candidatus Desantisbacteria bacterium CG2_30_40_21]PIP42129.1 MAG: hypothetical protein COX18_01455 [Candidatus Desantisbacteria bacterium CG23_combo_of_CG06-09_8_20_14_all_40_23]PIX17310.1 MAG: hypothetical protein COZ71_04075 [Candidatus Desantisbacteria bacterium CG_4_8_14_3_um_filter_40_12]PIY20087.1 MAG: hypothetical protein COZ13_01995 [Candidatus Desantisbacteria bacterium CG_4_10_14_3_um_filter_40_18]PJB29267.1 MAG: hypothetical protein CO110_06
MGVFQVAVAKTQQQDRWKIGVAMGGSLISPDDVNNEIKALPIVMISGEKEIKSVVGFSGDISYLLKR